MRRPLRKITATFLLVALVPFSVMIYELGMVNENEQIVKETYQNQLDAILYSVNQYSDDLISSWANRARLKINQPVDASDSVIWPSLFNQPEIVKGVYFSDMKSRSVLFGTSLPNTLSSQTQATLDKVLLKEEEKIIKLIEYERAGFRKMEAINVPVAENCIPVLFALEEGATGFTVGAIVLDLQAFIVNSLAPKMQTISQEEFIISAYRSRDDSLVYTTGSADLASNALQTALSFKDQVQKKDFWILPGYYLGISLKGATIDDLVKERTTTGLTVLGLLVLLLVVGFIFLYRNIRHEILLSQAKSEFVSNVSHEIRTPLSLIGMFAETLEAGRITTEEKKQEYYSIISKETIRLSKIVNRILDFSQLESNKKVFSFAPIKLNELGSEILDTYFHPLRESGFSFDFIKDSHLPVFAGDREAVSEAIINLLDNAVKYSKDAKHISIKTLSDHENVYIEVTDKGIGIAKQHLRDIFDQFYRAPTGDIHNTKGTGLGLTLVKKIMEAHHGNVTVESTLGKGSTFRLAFPIKKDNHES
jgi:two-component system phosphate regulon sensor histidine kinase PhoR